MFQFFKKKPLKTPTVEKISCILEPITQVYEADITYRRMKVYTHTQLLITDRKGIKVGDIMVSYADGRTEVLTPDELAQRQKEGKI